MRQGILLIDIGNSATTLAVAGRDGVGAPRRVMRLATGNRSPERISSAIRRLRTGAGFVGAMGASVVPAANAMWQRCVRQTAGCSLSWVRSDQSWNFRWRYPKPETVGADRIVNLCAARCRYRPPLLVLDFGTALTVDGLTADGAFHGGMIAPGFGMLRDGLAGRTALLPAFPLRFGRTPVRVMGRNTRMAMRSGLLIGYRGMVRTLVEEAVAALGPGVSICATGGYAPPVTKALPDIAWHVHPTLTLEGLAAAYRHRNDSAEWGHD